jgi:hypothetical protein
MHKTNLPLIIIKTNLILVFMTVFFIWEAILIFVLYSILKKQIKQGLQYTETFPEKGIKFLIKSKNPILRIFRFSLLWIVLLPFGIYFLLIPNEIFIYGILTGVVICSFLLLPSKEQNLPFAKELPFVLSLFGFAPFILSVLFLINIAVPVSTFSKTYPVSEFKTYSNPSANYWIKPEDELYKTTKVLLKIRQTELSVNEITVTYQYGICGLVKIKEITFR